MNVNVNAALSREPFQKKLAWGQAAETCIARWLIRQGYILLPVYDSEYDSGKGPRVFLKNVQLVAPDFLAWKVRCGWRASSGEYEDITIQWIEAKRKTHFTRYRLGDTWETGIDLRHYENYCRLRDLLKIPIWLFFLHESSVPSIEDLKYPECPSSCPTGLFAGEISDLRAKESHRSNRHASGMVYWTCNVLRKLASSEELKP
jgi:hypothetical protein